MNDQSFGRLSSVDLRECWEDEAKDFTPWLAQDHNLLLLGKTLGIELELEAQEKAVGRFKADILCKDANDGSWVLVENQLSRSDHKHLGQVLTNASGLGAETIVWIASDFTEEHRSILDWLNKITDGTFRFFGLAVELWRIGESPIAPKFNIVSEPNNWSRSIARAMRTPTETTQLQQDYWTALLSKLDEQGGPVTAGGLKAKGRPTMDFGLGKTGIRLRAAMDTRKQEICCELVLWTDEAKDYFAALYEQKHEIEDEFKSPLEWEERISLWLSPADPEEKDDWPRQHLWLTEKLNDMHRVLVKRIIMSFG
ncbi:MAG: DUF4268 domain-containing protein [Gammaproteobacteria bacterium]|nr:DUF4268 domain-containing protein [Gammaproteobacteria bacterium]MYL02337.1 DUF4268 domain-containing protein [Gammaproteobacteria bacterium]